MKLIRERCLERQERVEVLSHVNPEGDSSNNQFGKVFDVVGLKWTTAFCEKDSDGDGQELGDPCYKRSSTLSSKPLWVTDVLDPGAKSRTSNASRWANINCSATAVATTSGATPIATQSAVTIAMMTFAIEALLAIGL